MGLWENMMERAKNPGQGAQDAWRTLSTGYATPWGAPGEKGTGPGSTPSLLSAAMGQDPNKAGINAYDALTTGKGTPWASPGERGSYHQAFLGLDSSAVPGAEQVNEQVFGNEQEKKLAAEEKAYNEYLKKPLNFSVNPMDYAGLIVLNWLGPCNVKSGNVEFLISSRLWLACLRLAFTALILAAP